MSGDVSLVLYLPNDDFRALPAAHVFAINRCTQAYGLWKRDLSLRKEHCAWLSMLESFCTTGRSSYVHVCAS